MRTPQPHPRIQYIRDLFAPEDDCLENIRKNIEAEEFPIQVGAEEAKLLQLLIKLSQAKDILEIGTHAAYSTIWMARALPEEGRIFTIENSPARAERARKNIHNSDVSHKIHLQEGDALKCLATIQDKWDLIFIDADKINYGNYLDWAETHIRDGGLIIGDNTFLFENVYKDHPDKTVRPAAVAAMKDFNKRLSDPSKYISIMLPTSEGLTIALKI
ncbi:MAG: O-methyltransferase [Alphaproteobacteria bacterium]|nr:O-methyltransferase [Alphaproteobacteria bacterium]